MKIRKLFPAVLMALALAVHSAGAENMIQINGDQPPKSAEEILQMVEEAADDYYRDQEVAEELRGEISHEDVDDGFGETLTIYTLKHGGNAMRFLMATRAPSRDITSFYWLRADPSVDEGEIQVLAGDENIIVVTPKNVNGDFSILIHPALIDVSRPVHFMMPEGEVDVAVNPSEETLRKSMRETGDPCLAWIAEIPYSTLVSALQ